MMVKLILEENSSFEKPHWNGLQADRWPT